MQALRDVSLELRPGELVALTGPSGSGKSTLLHLIGALDQPSAGRILVDGEPLAGAPSEVDYRRRTVGFVFQLSHLVPVLSAEANVELPLIAQGVPHRERRDRARELLAEVGLAHRADHKGSELAGGERQRVAIARALAGEPRLLLADEPTGSLDSESGRQVLALLARVRDERGVTMLVVSHDPAVGAGAERVLAMSDGRLLADGAATAARAAPRAGAG